MQADQWTHADLSPGQHNTQLGSGFVANSPGEYWSRNDVYRGKTAPSLETLTSSIELVEGCTYAFSFVILKVQNNGPNQPDHTDQKVSLSVGGTTIIQATTGTPTGSEIGLQPTAQRVSGTFTAPSTGRLPLVITFTLMPPAPGNYGNDDIRVSDWSVLTA